MALVCEGIANVTINGTNYGATLYDLKIDVNFNSSTVFMASFVNENGVYNISPDHLNAESPQELRFNKTLNGAPYTYTYDIYPVSYKYQASPAGKLLVVKYVDSGHKYLDKHWVGINGMAGSSGRVWGLIPVKKEIEDIELGKYSPSALAAKIGGPLFPATNRAIATLNGCSGTNGVLLDSIGSVRDILGSIGSQIGCLFYWDWSLGKVGALDVINGVSMGEAKAFANKIQNTIEIETTEGCEGEPIEKVYGYNKYISSLEESYSIEENFANGAFVYDIDVDETGERLNISLKSVNYRHMNIVKANFWREPNPSAKSYFAQNVLLTKSFHKLCVAAMAGEDTFKKYIFWTIAARASNLSFSPLKSSLGTGTEKTTNLNIGKREDYNALVIALIKDHCNARIVFHKPKDKTLMGYANELKKSGYLARANEIQKLMESAKKDTPISTKFRDNVTQYWQVAIRKNKHFDTAITDLYNTCKTFGENYQRHYLSSTPMSTLDTTRPQQNQPQVSLTPETSDLKTVSQGDYTDYNMNEEWIYEKEAVDNTFLNSILSYKKQPHLSEAENYREENTDRPSIKSFIGTDLEDPKFYIIDNSEEKPPNLTADEEAKLRGYIYYDMNKERKFSVKCDIFMEKTNTISPANRIIGEDVGAIETYLINSSSNMENILAAAAVSFNKDREGQQIIPKFTKVYKKTSPVASQKYSTFSSQWAHQSMTDGRAMANTLTINKTPEATEDFICNKAIFLDHISKEWGDSLAIKASYNFTIEKLVPLDLIDGAFSWIQKGLESYSLSYSGDGVTTNITIGSRKKQRQSMENIERLTKVPAGQGVDFTKMFMPRPSAAKGSIMYGLKAFS